MKNSNPLSNPDAWTLVGHFGVDAGLCWIGDPCYILHKDKDHVWQPRPDMEPLVTKAEGLPESLGKDWGDFVDKLYADGESGPTLKSFPYALGHEGLGICTSTGYGDGEYPVYALVINDDMMGKRVAALFVDFFGLFNKK